MFYMCIKKKRLLCTSRALSEKETLTTTKTAKNRNKNIKMDRRIYDNDSHKIHELKKKELKNYSFAV